VVATSANALGDYLRARREQLRPDDVGLVPGTRRRVQWRTRKEHPGVLALGTAQRNAAAAFVVAGQNFDDAKVIVMITVVLIVDFLMLLPFARILARGHSKTMG